MARRSNQMGGRRTMADIRPTSDRSRTHYMLNDFVIDKMNHFLSSGGPWVKLEKKVAVLQAQMWLVLAGIGVLVGLMGSLIVVVIK